MGMNRNTNRKNIIRELLENRYHYGPLLLEELRWNTLLIECSSKGSADIEMTRSYRNSFSRTIREHFDEYFIQKLPRPDALYAGIVTRAAVYRIANWEKVVKFLSGSEPTVFVRVVKGSSKTDKARVYCKLFSKYPSRSSTRVELSYPFFDGQEEKDTGRAWDSYHWDKTYLVDTIIFPASLPLSMVVCQPIRAYDLKRAADVKWDIYRNAYPHLDRKPTIIRDCASIRSHWKDGYLKNPLSRGSWSNAAQS